MEITPKRAGKLKLALDFAAFPVRSLTMINDDRWGFSSLRSERFEHVARHVRGHCLDVGCGEGNLFVEEYLGGKGAGIDVYPYKGLTSEQIVENMSRFPFSDGSFQSVTFIANLNHVPEPMRDIELGEAYRVLETGGNIIVTMGVPLVEVLAHQYIFLLNRLFGAQYEDTEKGMHHDEHFFVPEKEILNRLSKAGFSGVVKKRFGTQWGLNQLYLGWKR